MNKRNRHKNIKKILDVYSKCPVEKKTLEEILSVEKDSIRPIITTLNKNNLLDKICYGNKLKDDIYNKTIFNDKNYNIDFVASLIYSEEENTEKIIKYMFRTSVDNMLFSIINKYSTNFQKNIEQLIDIKKYNQFALIIKENTKENIDKIVCKINLTSTRKVETIIPLEFFIFDDSWFICAYFLDKRKITIIDAKDIDELTTLDDKNSNYINLGDVEKCIKDYILNHNNKNEEFVALRLNAETLSLLIEFGLLIENKYELFEDNTENTSRLNFIDQSILNKKLSENKVEDKLENEIIFNKRITFYQEDTKKYIVKTKLTKHKLNFILSYFSNIDLIKTEE